MNSLLTHCWMSPYVLLVVFGIFCRFYLFFVFFLWKILLANNVDPDQTPHGLVPDQGLHCLLTLNLLSLNLFQFKAQLLKALLG